MPGGVLKQAIFTAMINHGVVVVHVDGRRCIVPGALRAPGLVLQLGHGLTPPINLVIDDHGIAARLMFEGVEHECFVPWVALYVITDGDAQTVWPKEFPTEAPVDAPKPRLRSVD